MKLEKVSDRVYANCEGKTGGNVGIVIMDDAVAAVDAQYPVSGADFRVSIPGITPKPLTHLLLTHVHGDHVFGNQAFEDCTIVSHRRLKEKMEESLKAEWAPGNIEKMLEDVKRHRPERAYLFQGLRIVLPNETIEDSLTLPGLEMTHLPGHTDCSSIVYIPDDKVCFAGDLIFAKTFPWAGDPTADPDHWIQAFETLLRMDVETYVPGHGLPCVKEEIETQLSWFESVRDGIKKLIAEGATEAEVVHHDGYPEFYASEGDRRERSLKHWYNFYTGKI
jgi:cyclase